MLQHVVLKVGPGPAKRIEIGSHPGPSGARPAGAARSESCARPRATCGPIHVRWTSSAPGTARVTRGGMLEARGPGKATLTAAVGGVRATTVSRSRPPRRRRSPSSRPTRARSRATWSGSGWWRRTQAGGPIADVTPVVELRPRPGRDRRRRRLRRLRPGQLQRDGDAGRTLGQRASDGDPPRGAPDRQRSWAR